MGLTGLGIVLIPLSLVFAFDPKRLLQIALVAAVFEAAAACVFGAFGLQPALVPGLLFMAYTCGQYALGMRYPGEALVLRAMLPLLLFLAYAILSAWLLPSLFAGEIFVAPQRGDPLDASMLVPLEFTFGNVTQTLYLSLNIAFAVAVAIFLTRSAISYRSIIAAYLAGGYVVVGLVLWEFGSRVAGIPFPDELLHSNPGWAIMNQAMGSVPRVQGPFTEPAALSSYMLGICLCTLVLSVRGHRIMGTNVLLALSVLSILLSTSTTGIVGLAIGMPAAVVLASGGGNRGALRRVGRTFGGLLLGGSLFLGPIFVLKPSLLEAVENVVEETLTKGQSDSYNERTGTDLAALDTFAPSLGLGVGWGSFRSSSLVPGLLSNAGIFGVVLPLWLAARVRRLGAQGRAASPRHAGRILVDGFSAALCAQVLTALVSAPMINSLSFFLQLGCVVGVLVRMAIEPRLEASRRMSVRLDRHLIRTREAHGA